MLYVVRNTTLRTKEMREERARSDSEAGYGLKESCFSVLMDIVRENTQTAFTGSQSSLAWGSIE